MELNHGNCTRSSKFELVVHGKRQVLTYGFEAPEGTEFVSMLLGTVKVGEPADIDKMVAELGLVVDADAADEILRLKAVIFELEAKLAAKE